jgi:cell shape-determining protein MreC
MRDRRRGATTVPKGDVISTSARSGSRPADAKVAVVESTGKPKHTRR